MKQPRSDGHQPAHREPLGAEELGGAMQDAFENAESCQELREPE